MKTKCFFLCASPFILSSLCFSSIAISRRTSESIIDVNSIKLKGNVADYNGYYSHFLTAINQAKEYNSEWNPSSIEFAKEIDVLNENNDKAVYLDFDGDNGFMVVNDNQVFKVNYSGDLYQLQHLNNFAYSPVDDFVFYSEEKYRYEKIYDDDFVDVICTADEVLGAPAKHNGQESAGDGQIYDLQSYVADRYSNYKYVESSYLKNYRCAYQNENSVFAQKWYKSNGDLASTYSSEGNCVINSTYSMLSNLPTVKNYNGYQWKYNNNYSIGLSGMDYSEDVYTDELYPNYGSHNFISSGYDNSYKDTISKYWEINDFTNSSGKTIITDLPMLYMQLRTVGVQNGYRPNEGMLFSNSEKMVEQIDRFYGYEIDLQLTGSLEAVTSNLSFGIPSLISTNGSETFGNHAMAVYGYAKYSYEVRILWHTETRYAYFWMVDSGWKPSASWNFIDNQGNRINWFDPNQSSTSFAVLNRNTLEWPE